MESYKEEFRKYILSEIKKIIYDKDLSHNSLKNNDVESKVNESDTNKEKEILNLSKTDTPIQNILKEDFELISGENEKTNPTDVKKLSQEFKRWKQLVDFRSPLLIKD